MQRGYLHIPVQHLSDEPFHISLACPADKIGLDGFIGEIGIEATVRRVDRRLQLVCKIIGDADSLCDRCAEPFIGHYIAEYEQWYVVDSHPEMVEQEEEDTHAINPEQRDIVIDDDVRENMLVSLPMKRLCREDCQGLCPQCGRNRNLEPCSCEEEKDNPLWTGLKNVNQ